MRKISKARSSRRAPALKDSDYDHEINLVDHAAEAETATPHQLSLGSGADAPRSIERTGPSLDESRVAGATASPTLSKYRTALSDAAKTPQPGPSSPRGDRSSSSPATVTRSRASSTGSSLKSEGSKCSSKRFSLRRRLKDTPAIPTVEVNEPTPLNQPTRASADHGPRHRASAETAIDVLYENQRGGLLCGIPLFSSKALGQLDPPAWTNFAHKSSPTNIDTAQVPDPSWVWVWPEWRVNKEEGLDPDGWEYSFMFSKKFSWHSPKWYNSYVRRRAWIRKRARRDVESNDPHMLSTEYFTVRPSTETTRPGSKASSRHSRASASISSWALEKTDIVDMETLMSVLRRARIDREKIEAIESFLEYGEEELAQLQDKMHEIMAIFVFQASRRVLLSKLHELFVETQEELRANDTGRLQRRSTNLAAAIRHADEEVTKLEYWSDQKRLVKEGETKTATDHSCGWDDSWRGLDNSGLRAPDSSRCDLKQQQQ